VFKRGNLATRFDLRNGFGACRRHHHWQETHPEKSEPYLIQIVGGIEIYNELDKLSNSTVKFYPEQVKEIRKSLIQFVHDFNRQILGS